MLATSTLPTNFQDYILILVVDNNVLYL